MTPPALTEKQITAALFAHWNARGVAGCRLFSIPNARAFGQTGLTPGVFDLGVIGPQIGCAFLELKTETGKLSAAQEDFKAALISNNVRYAVAYGLDQAIQTLELWGVLRPEGGTHDRHRHQDPLDRGPRQRHRPEDGSPPQPDAHAR